MGTGVSPRRIATGNVRVISYKCTGKGNQVLEACFHKTVFLYALLDNSTVTTLYFFILRKEVIQPHLPIRLPCYDFTPVTNPAFGSSSLSVRSLTSGVIDSHGVTGGVYKTRERIHRDMLIRDY